MDPIEESQFAQLNQMNLARMEEIHRGARNGFSWWDSETGDDVCQRCERLDEVRRSGRG